MHICNRHIHACVYLPLSATHMTTGMCLCTHTHAVATVPPGSTAHLSSAPPITLPTLASSSTSSESHCHPLHSPSPCPSHTRISSSTPIPHLRAHLRVLLRCCSPAEGHPHIGSSAPPRATLAQKKASVHHVSAVTVKRPPPSAADRGP